MNWSAYCTCSLHCTHQAGFQLQFVFFNVSKFNFLIFKFNFFDKLVGTLHQRAPLHSPDWLLVFFNFQLSNFNFQQKKIIWSMFLLRALVCNGPAQHSLQQCWTKISLDTPSLLVSLLVKMRLVVTLTWVVFPQLATAAHFWKGWPDWNNSCH